MIEARKRLSISFMGTHCSFLFFVPSIRINIEVMFLLQNIIRTEIMSLWFILPMLLGLLCAIFFSFSYVNVNVVFADWVMFWHP